MGLTLEKVWWQNLNTNLWLCGENCIFPRARGAWYLWIGWSDCLNQGTKRCVSMSTTSIAINKTAYLPFNHQKWPKTSNLMIFELSQPNPNFGHKWTCNCKMVLLSHLKPILKWQTGGVNSRKGLMAKFKHKSLTLWGKLYFPARAAHDISR